MRLIDADKIQYAKDWVVTDRISKVGGYNAKAIYRVTKEEIDAMPTVDAVPVVRCKGCKYWKTDEGVNWSKKVKFCTYAIDNSYARCDEDFCSRGERKEGDNETD